MLRFRYSDFFVRRIAPGRPPLFKATMNNEPDRFIAHRSAVSVYNTSIAFRLSNATFSRSMIDNSPLRNQARGS